MLAPLLAMTLVAGPRIAVMPIRAGIAVAPGEAAALTEVLIGEVRRRSGADVVSQGEITSVLSLEQQKRMLGCSTDACMAELGGALGVERLVTGDVAKLGESLLVHVRLIDSGKVKVLGQSDRRLKRGSFDDLLDTLPAMVSELFPGAPGREAAPAATPSPRPPSTPRPAPALPAAAFQPPEGMFAIHLRGGKDRALVAWSEEPSIDGKRMVRRYVTQWNGYLEPTGTTDFGSYWLLPAAEFKAGAAGFAFVVPSQVKTGIEPTLRYLGNGTCGATSWALSRSRQVWMDPRDCVPRATLADVRPP